MTALTRERLVEPEKRGRAVVYRGLTVEDNAPRDALRNLNQIVLARIGWVLQRGLDDDKFGRAVRAPAAGRQTARPSRSSNTRDSRLRGFLDVLLLGLLLHDSERHVLALKRRLEESLGGMIDADEMACYTQLYALEREGLVRSVRIGNRVEYHLTADGRHALGVRLVEVFRGVAVLERTLGIRSAPDEREAAAETTRLLQRRPQLTNGFADSLVVLALVSPGGERTVHDIASDILDAVGTPLAAPSMRTIRRMLRLLRDRGLVEWHRKGGAYVYGALTREGRVAARVIRDADLALVAHVRATLLPVLREAGLARHEALEAPVALHRSRDRLQGFLDVLTMAVLFADGASHPGALSIRLGEHGIAADPPDLLGVLRGLE